jgi:hypothetical protein
VQLLARPHDPTRPCRDPKIIEMFEIHGRIILRFFRIKNIKNTNLHEVNFHLKCDPYSITRCAATDRRVLCV